MVERRRGPRVGGNDGTPWPGESTGRKAHGGVCGGRAVAAPLAGAAGGRCPLPSPNEPKDEADVSFLALDQGKTAHSRSCMFESAELSLSPAAGLDAKPKPKPCASAMRRLENGDLMVEAWSLGAAATLIEVSRKGLGCAEDRWRFRGEVVRPLLAADAVPVDRSKSELGSDCRSPDR